MGVDSGMFVCYNVIVQNRGDFFMMIDVEEVVNKKGRIEDLVTRLYSEQGMTKTIERVCDFAINTKDLDFCLQLAKILYAEDVMLKFQSVILESKDAEKCYYFARDVKKADVKALEKIVLESNIPYLSYEFAYNIIDADIEAHQKIVLNSKNVRLCYEFARDVKV